MSTCGKETNQCNRNTERVWFCLFEGLGFFYSYLEGYFAQLNDPIKKIILGLQ